MNLPDHIHPIAVDDALLNIGMTINEIRVLTGDPAPQTISTVEELGALDPDTVVLDGVGEIYPVRYYLDADDDEKMIYERYLPAAKVAEGAHVRACREALREVTP